MSSSLSLVAAFPMALLAVSPAMAQQPTANPLDTIPEKMPFSTPYGPPISLQQAQSATQVAIAEATKRGGIPLVADGKIIGAIGCSGGAGSRDEAICTAGAATTNK